MVVFTLAYFIRVFKKFNTSFVFHHYSSIQLTKRGGV